jgi:hypothetical protein
VKGLNEPLGEDHSSLLSAKNSYQLSR